MDKSECKDLTVTQSYVIGITRHVFFNFTVFVALSENFLISSVHTDTYVSIRSTDYLTGMCSASPSPDSFREPRCANTNLLRSAGKFTKQLPSTIITASTLNCQYYKICVLYVPQILRKTVAGKHNLCCGLHIFCGLAVFPGLTPRVTYTYITVRLRLGAHWQL